VRVYIRKFWSSSLQQTQQKTSSFKAIIRDNKMAVKHCKFDCTVFLKNIIAYYLILLLSNCSDYLGFPNNRSRNKSVLMDPPQTFCLNVYNKQTHHVIFIYVKLVTN